MWKLHDYRCPEGHEWEALEATPLDQWSICPTCHLVGERQIGGQHRQLYYAEGRARVDWHLGPEPVVITSEKQHSQLMKKAGVTLAGTRRGMKGQWI